MSNPTLLRGLKIRKVDLVDQGANQHAHIKLAKRKEQEPTDEPDREDRAFFEGFKKFFAQFAQHREQGGEVAKAEARTFSEEISRSDFFDKLWRISRAMCESIEAIVKDNDVDDAEKVNMITESADQVANAIKTELVSCLKAGVMKADDEDPDEDPDDPDDDEAEPTGKADSPENDDGEDEDENKPKSGATNTEKANCGGSKKPAKKGVTKMNFDTSRMSPEEKAQFEDLAKRFGIAENEPATPPAPEANPDTDEQDVYKGLHPAIRAELESLRKFREDSEDRELLNVAKRYTILGKKPEELVPTLKSLRAAGGTAYDDMIALLDANVAAVEKSGVFGEVGKRGTGDTSGDSWGKIEAAASEIMKSNAGMTRAQAIDQACVEHPELLEAYEKSRY